MKKATYGLIGAVLWGLFIAGITPDLFWGRSLGFGLVGGFAILFIAKSVCGDGKSDNESEGQS
jgi:hypothetical protein